jgi:tetratricopeptide (TPR) repeat protein
VQGQTENLIREAVDLFNRGDYKEAVKYAKKAAKLDPGNFIPYGIIANALFDLRKYDKSIKYYGEELRRNPPKENQVLIWYNIARAYSKYPRYDDVIECCNIVLSIDVNEYATKELKIKAKALRDWANNMLQQRPNSDVNQLDNVFAKSIVAIEGYNESATRWPSGRSYC